MCPHTPIHVSSYHCMCVLILLYMCAASLLYMCADSAIYVSSSYCRCVCILPYICLLILSAVYVSACSRAALLMLCCICLSAVYVSACSLLMLCCICVSAVYVSLLYMCQHVYERSQPPPQYDLRLAPLVRPRYPPQGVLKALYTRS
jgi:hypothetical protein